VNSREKLNNPRIEGRHRATVGDPRFAGEPVMPNDDSCEFKWNDTQSVVVKQQDAIAVYANPDDDIVIRRRQAWDEQDDVFIVIGQTQARTVIAAMERVIKEIEGAKL
jgi:hypothetical protein